MSHLVPFNGNPTPPTRAQLEAANLRELSRRGRDAGTSGLIQIIKTADLSSEVVSNSVVSTDTCVGWCPAPHEGGPVRFFAASQSRVSVYQLGSTVSGLYLPHFLYRATQPFTAVAVPFMPRQDTPAFLLGYQGGEVQVAQVAGEGEEWHVERVSLPSSDSPRDCVCLAWNSCSDLMAAGDSSGFIHIAHLSTCHLLRKLRFLSLPARQLRFLSRSGLVSCDGSDTVCHWDLRSPSSVCHLASPPLSCPVSGAPPVLGIDVAPERVACVDQEGRCVLWDTRDTRRPLSLHQGHAPPLSRMDPHALRPAGVCLAGDYLCVGACHSQVALYHLALPGPLCRHWYGADTFGSATIPRLEFSPRAKRVIATDSLGAVKLLALATPD